MANVLRIKRRASGGAGSPTSLANAELAFNEVDNVLYYGKGTGGAGGTATTVEAIGGVGAFCAVTGNQTIAGIKTFSSTITGSVSGNAGTATVLETARTIGGVSFDGSANINLPGVNSAGNQNTTGNAATATALATGRVLSFTGDATGAFAEFNGTSALAAALTLATVNSNVGTFNRVTVNAKGLVTAAVAGTLNDIPAPTADYSMGSRKITSLATPTADADAATKAYVDSVAQGLKTKDSVRATTTGDITLSGAQTIDGVSIVAGNRVLVRAQSAPATNGIYIAAAGAWSRALDADTYNEMISAFTFVESGTEYADTGWVCTADPGGTLETTALNFAQFSSGGSYTASTGLTLTGSAFSITNTAVSPASYGAAGSTLSITVNAQGQLTAASAQSIAITNGQVSGLGTMSTQAANSVAITGGSITNLTTFDGITIDGGTF